MLVIAINTILTVLALHFLLVVCSLVDGFVYVDLRIICNFSTVFTLATYVQMSMNVESYSLMVQLYYICLKVLILISLVNFMQIDLIHASL